MDGDDLKEEIETKRVRLYMDCDKQSSLFFFYFQN